MDTENRPGMALLQREHGVLVRQIAGLQTRVSHQMQVHANQVADLERALLTARAQILLLRTAVLWGMDRDGLTGSSTGKSPRQQPSSRPTPAPRSLNEADTLICQTGCTGHAHPWLEDDGQCRRTGQTCGRALKNMNEGQTGD